MAGNYTNRRNTSAQMNTRTGAGNGRTAGQRGNAQYQYGAAAAQPVPTRRRSSSQGSASRRQSTSQAASTYRQSMSQGSASRRQSASQAATTYRQSTSQGSASRRQSASQAATTYRQSTSQGSASRRQSMSQAAPAYRQSASQASPARRQAPVRHQVDIRAEKAKVNLKASPVDKLGLLVLTLAFVFLAVMVLRYVSLQSDITQLRSSIQTKESEINELADSNDEYLNRIEASVDLEKVREIAIMDLGMVYASEDQIITYDSQIDDYLEQSVVITDED
ncbi:MAG: hypothetical protein LUC90_04735 [Lachnospiraceae bacterium]|nr:hypothetical protein [Lachnospiraceae bacterium]